MDAARLILFFLVLGSAAAQNADALTCGDLYPAQIRSVVVDGEELQTGEYPEPWLDGDFWLAFEPFEGTPCTIEVWNYPEWQVVARADQC